MEPEITPPGIVFAAADTADTVTFTFLTAPADYGVFAVYRGNTRLAGNSARGKTAKEGIITLDEKITDPAEPYTVRDESGALADKPVAMRNILNSFYYAGDDLGLRYGTDKSAFKVWAPTALSVSLALYREPGAAGDGADDAPDKLHAMERDGETMVWSVIVPGDLAGLYYLYRAEFADGRVSYAVDPYARAAGINGKRGLVVNLPDTAPPGFREQGRPRLDSPVDALIYELHVRDLSTHPNSGIRHKGKFLGLTETGTKNARGLSTGLDHIRDLGVTHIHLLPSFDFKTIDEANLALPQFNWGYDPQNYNLPEGSYSTDPFDGTSRIREFKELVRTLHQQGLGVIMDVVYNHTYNAGDSNFSALVPFYYYRTDSQGRYTDGSACGNETASERPMMGKFIVDSVGYWAREYQIDGFRFDLMGLHDVDTMNAVRRELDGIDPSIIIYGEGWIAADSPLPPGRRAVKANAPLLDERIAVFSDDIRDGIRGSVFYEKESGFVSAPASAQKQESRTEDVKFGIAGGVRHPDVDITAVHYSRAFWAGVPGQAVNYASAHDNLTLWDKLAATNPGADDDTLIRLNKLAAAIVLTSQGIPFFQAGEEMARTKQGNENSYNAPDAINMLDWDRKTRFLSLTDYYRGLITLRKTYDVFRLRRAEDVRERLRFMPQADGELIAYTLENRPQNGKYPLFALIFNGSNGERQVGIPPGEWDILVNGEKAGTTPLGRISGGSVSVPAKTVLALGRL